MPDTAPFIYSTRIRFHQADPAGVLFYSRVFELVNDAYEELVRVAGFHYDDHFGLQDYATPVVHLEVDYRRPMLAGERLRVELGVSRIGQSSFTLAFTVRGDEGHVRATGNVIHAFVQAATFTTIDIPEVVRSALAPYVIAG